MSHLFLLTNFIKSACYFSWAYLKYNPIFLNFFHSCF